MKLLQGCPMCLNGSLLLTLLCPAASGMSDSLWPRGLHPARLLCPWDSPVKNTGVGSHALLQVIFPTQGLAPGLLNAGRFLESPWNTWTQYNRCEDFSYSTRHHTHTHRHTHTCVHTHTHIHTGTHMRTRTRTRTHMRTHTHRHTHTHTVDTGHLSYVTSMFFTPHP